MQPEESKVYQPLSDESDHFNYIPNKQKKNKDNQKFKPNVTTDKINHDGIGNETINISQAQINNDTKDDTQIVKKEDSDDDAYSASDKDTPPILVNPE